LDEGESSADEIYRDMIEAERERPSFLRTSTDEGLKQLAAIALRDETRLADALPRYIDDRGLGNRLGFKALSPATVGDV
jgi:hypothetical protein